MAISKFILTKILGWKINDEFPQVAKSVIVFAPHTSYFDAIYGTLCLRSVGINYKLLSKKELFFLPMNIAMWALNAIPVRGVKGHNAIFEASNLIKSEDSIHLVICPEGTTKPNGNWNPGFLYIAERSKVPVLAVYMDFGNRECGVKVITSDNYDKHDVYCKLRDFYSNVTAYNPSNFVLPNID